MDTASLGQAFLDRAPIPGVEFWHNDYVRVIAGQHAGSTGSLVTVLSLQPQPRFVMELGSGRGDMSLPIDFYTRLLSPLQAVRDEVDWAFSKTYLVRCC